MEVSVLADEALTKELMEKELPAEVNINFVNTLEELVLQNAEVYMDLLFKKKKERIKHLANLLPKPVFINAVTYTLKELGQPFIRINAWPGFLSRKIIEIAVASEAERELAGSVLSILRWPFQAVPDEPGMIAGRVIAMIVNEAYYVLGDNVSTKEAIDIAMRLGTNYPYGPFEWSEHIGLQNIYELLLQLSKTDDRYLVARTMIDEINTKNIH